jgi:hypothetical protein
MPLTSEPTLPTPAPDAVAHSQRVAEHIAERIVAEGDWIPFARYMELALSAPGLGYYAAGARKFGERATSSPRPRSRCSPWASRAGGRS